MVETIHALAFEEARRAIAQQQAALESVRTRVTVLFSASAVAASVSGASAPGTSGVAVFSGAVSIGLLAAIAFITVHVLLPRKWKFSVDVTQLVQKGDSDPPTSIATAHRNLALYMQRHWKTNQDQLDGMMRWYAAGCWVSVLLVTVRVGSTL